MTVVSDESCIADGDFTSAAAAAGIMFNDMCVMCDVCVCIYDINI